MAHAGGRPRIISTGAELDAAVTAYFASISGPAIDSDTGLEYTKWLKIPSLAGLALFCGYCDKDMLYQVSQRSEEFSIPYKRAKAIMEDFKQSNLYTLKNSTGCIFDLKVNHGYQDSQQIDLNINDLGAVKALRDRRKRSTD